MLEILAVHFRPHNICAFLGNFFKITLSLNFCIRYFQIYFSRHFINFNWKVPWNFRIFILLNLSGRLRSTFSKILYKTTLISYANCRIYLATITPYSTWVKYPRSNSLRQNNTKIIIFRTERNHFRKTVKTNDDNWSNYILNSRTCISTFLRFTNLLIRLWRW